MTGMAQLRCTICGRLFQPEQSPAMPFCSHRCRLVDLGRWLDERCGLTGPEENEREVGSEEMPPVEDQPQ
jgi:endogenous inhibitor of DNA gyrase (YacG/DUF329 family)